ncbi:MAG: DinB family protein [Thermoplasmata archaeon]|nr:DinB family protein [Thermoplasmata archaeon]
MARPLKFPLGDALSVAEYNRAVFERFARRVRRLPRQGAFRRRGIGHESLFDTLVHILNVQEVWLVYIARGRNSDRELEALFEDSSRHPKEWKGFDAYASRVWKGVDETLSALGPPDLERRVKAFWMPGNYTLRDAILQTTLEEAHHLGEIIGALWQKDVEPPEMTWIDTRRTISRPVAHRST